MKNNKTKIVKDTGCCPLLPVAKWQDKTFDWKNKLFVKDRVRTFFYMPLNIGKVMTRLAGKVAAVGAEFQDGLVLADHTSKWNMDIYVAVDKKIKGLESKTMSGKFYTRVYEGPHYAMKEWAVDWDKIVKAKKLSVKKLYMWYTTCPACAKAYGKNYVVFVAELA